MQNLIKELFVINHYLLSQALSTMSFLYPLYNATPKTTKFETCIC